MSQDEGYPSYSRRRTEALKADSLRGYRAAFADIYGGMLSEDGAIFTPSNAAGVRVSDHLTDESAWSYQEAGKITVESLERTAQEITREVNARREVNYREAGVHHGVPFFIDQSQSDIWNKYMALMFGRPGRTLDMNAYYDGVKAAAREARIMRNSGDGVCLPLAITTWARIHQEDALAQAIERTQLPHEMTIHERIMPYRVKE